MGRSNSDLKVAGLRWALLPFAIASALLSSDETPARAQTATEENAAQAQTRTEPEPAPSTTSTIDNCQPQKECSEASTQSQRASDSMVFYVTDRRAVTSPKRLRYSKARVNDLSYGWCESAASAEGAKPHMKPRQFESPTQFYESLKSLQKQTGKQRMIVFVHGYRRSFEATMKVAERLSKASNLPVIAFAWPSHNNPLAYFADESNAEWSVPHLTAFLSDLERQCPIGDVSIVAHSLGTRLVNWSLAKRIVNEARFKHIYLISPDMDVQTFNNHVGNLMGSSSTVRVFISNADVRLGASSILHGSQRVGKSSKLDGITAEHIVDFTKVDNGFLGHSIPYSLLSSLLAQ